MKKEVNINSINALLNPQNREKAMQSFRNKCEIKRNEKLKMKMIKEEEQKKKVLDLDLKLFEMKQKRLQEEILKKQYEEEQDKLYYPLSKKHLNIVIKFLTK